MEVKVKVRKFDLFQFFFCVEQEVLLLKRKSIRLNVKVIVRGHGYVVNLLVPITAKVRFVIGKSIKKEETNKHTQIQYKYKYNRTSNSQIESSSTRLSHV